MKYGKQNSTYSKYEMKKLLSHSDENVRIAARIALDGDDKRKKHGLGNYFEVKLADAVKIYLLNSNHLETIK